MISHLVDKEQERRKHLQETCVLMTVLLSVGCATQPDRNAALEDMRTVYAAAQADPQVVRLAPLELNQATDALRRAETAWTDRAGAEQVGHLAYLAMMRAAIATEVARLRAAENAVAAAVPEQSRIQLEVRARATAREQAAAALKQQEQLESLQAVKTNRGMVVTLGDILFDSDQASLNPTGLHFVQKLAEFMNRYQRRMVAIEGFTDNAGSARYSKDLSESRADAVRRSLLDAGVGANRITTRSYGKDFPIATNDTVAGRTWNRRVEIVISDENGNIVAR
jgi:outer membrane protein OmpA-like peptidoglycan-associated protein